MIRIFKTWFFLMLVAKMNFAQPNIAWNQFYTLPGKASTLTDYKMDSQGNLNLAIDLFDSATTFLNSAVVKYDPTGQISWQYLSTNPIANQTKRLLLDQNDNVYLLTWDGSQNDIIKIDGNSGSQVWDFPLDTSFYSAEMALDSNNIYVAQSAPDLLLTKLDLSGNLISTTPLDFLQRIYSIQKTANSLVIIGDTIVNNFQWYLRLHQLSTSGVYINKMSSSVPQPSVTDIQLVSDSLVYVTGSGATLPYLIKFNLSGSVWDTVFNVSNTATNMGKLVEMNSSLYWSYIRSESTGTFFYLNSVNNTNVVNLTTNDSCRGLNFDICADSNNVIYSAAAFRTSSLNYTDYDINAFSPLTGLIWNYRYTLSTTSKEIPKFIDELDGSLYILGDEFDNPTGGGGSKVNILKLNSITGINHISGEKELKIYPNPSSVKTINISGDLQNATITIYDTHGKLRTSIHDFKNNILDLSELNSGMYLIRISTKNWTRTQKLILN